MQRSASKQNHVWAIPALFAGATFWGLVWYPYRVLEDVGVSGEVSTLLTYVVALLIGVVAFRTNLREAGASWRVLLGIALSAGWTNLAYVLAIINGEVVRVLLLFYLSPLWTLIFARVLLAEHMHRTGYLVIALSLAGAFTMLWLPDNPLPLPQTVAEWLGLSGGLTFALSNVLVRKASATSVQMKALAVWGGVTLVTLPYCLLDLPASLAAIDAASWWTIAAVGALLFLFSVIVQYGVSHTPANRAIVIFLSELVVAALAAYWLAGETMTLREWLGGAMIVSASLYSSRVAH